MNKKKVHISIDESVWNLAKEKLPCSRSEYIETQLRTALNIQDEESKIMDEINELDLKKDALKTKLCKIREMKAKRLAEENILEKAMVPIHRIVENIGFVGRDQLASIANHHDISVNDLEKYCISQEIKISNFHGGYREAKNDIFK